MLWIGWVLAHGTGRMACDDRTRGEDNTVHRKTRIENMIPLSGRNVGGKAVEPRSGVESGGGAREMAGSVESGRGRFEHTSIPWAKKTGNDVENGGHRSDRRG
jgi:hypothetical protein